MIEELFGSPHKIVQVNNFSNLDSSITNPYSRGIKGLQGKKHKIWLTCTILQGLSTIFKDPSVFDHPLIVEKVKRITCCNKNVWILSDITSANQVHQIAKILKIPGKMFNQE